MALIDTYSTPLDAKAAEHLLRRTMFGATRKDIAQLTGQTAVAAVQTLLADQPVPDAPIDPLTGQQWVTAAYDGTVEGQRYQSLRGWWVGQMVTQPISIREKMVLFWQNHFVSTRSTVGDTRYMYKQNVLLRQYALGNVKAFTKDITTDPAMLRYLNGNSNRVGAAQENYGRELQELFTIGKGAEIAPGNYTTYTEDDVRTAARVLTGWTDTAATITSTFTPNRHDTTDKIFSAAYSGTVIKGRTGADGVKELDDLLDMIFKQPDTAKNLCREFYRWFINYDITPDIEQNFIVPLADVLRSNNYEMKPVLTKMLTSQHFFDQNLRGCIIKTPLDLVVGTMRQLQVAPPDYKTQPSQYLYAMESLRNTAGQLQQDIMEQPNVAGWAAYYQEPSYYQMWINTATLPNRVSFANTVLNGINVNVGGMNYKTFVFDSVEYAKLFTNPEDPVKLIENFCEHFFAVDLIQAQKDRLLTDVLLPGLPSFEWTVEWNDYIKNSTNANKKSLIKIKLDNLIRYMIGLAEFQVY